LTICEQCDEKEAQPGRRLSGWLLCDDCAVKEEARQRVMDDCRLSSGAKVLFWLLLYHGKTGIVELKLAEIEAKYWGNHRPKPQRCFEQLIEVGYIRTQRRETHTDYCLILQAAPTNAR
jgi:hypothetical protein